MAGKGIAVEYDKPRIMKFDFDAIVSFEKAAGMTLTAVSFHQLGFFLLQTLVWAGLKHEDPQLTESATGKLLNKLITEKTKTFEQIGDDLQAALQESGLFDSPGNAKAGAEKKPDTDPAKNE